MSQENISQDNPFLRMMAIAEQRGFKRLPPDHPIFSEGPTITFLRHVPQELKQQGQEGQEPKEE